MKKLLTVVTSCLFLGCAVLAHADGVAESWQCELKDGKTIADVQAINSKWLKWVNERVDGVVRSSVGTAIVGDAEIFLFVDSYPDLATWAAVKDALDSEEGSEVSSLFEETSECSGNRLWKMEETK